MENQVIQGDSLDELKKLPDNCIDSIVTDPPYELGFMGKSWDNTGIANNPLMWAECLRVLKPGGHLLAFSGTRTYHRMASAIEDAGFEVRDMIEWVYGSGFPKSLNIGKVTDKFLKTGNASWNGTGDSSNGALGYSKLQHKQDYRPEDYSNRHQNKADITEQKAKQWEGWGTALKPAHEPICMARKPLAEKTVAENCLKWGTGGINIDESRVESNEDTSNIKAFGSMPENKSDEKGFSRPWMNNKQSILDKQNAAIDKMKSLGRFPANLIHDNSEEVRECFPETGKSKAFTAPMADITGGNFKSYKGNTEKQTTRGHDDNGGNASRFFKSILYYPKASKSERNKGCEELEKEVKGMNFGGELTGSGEPVNIGTNKNFHPTVKPTALMSYLIKMVTPKDGIVLDPFAGSGTTGLACKNLNRNYILIEKEPEYVDIIKARLKAID